MPFTKRFAVSALIEPRHNLSNRLYIVLANSSPASTDIFFIALMFFHAEDIAGEFVVVVEMALR